MLLVFYYDVDIFVVQFKGNTFPTEKWYLHFVTFLGNQLIYTISLHHEFSWLASVYKTFYIWEIIGATVAALVSFYDYRFSVLANFELWFVWGMIVNLVVKFATGNRIGNKVFCSIEVCTHLNFRLFTLTTFIIRSPYIMADWVQNFRHQFFILFDYYRVYIVFNRNRPEFALS